MLDPEMIDDTAQIVNEALKDRAQVNLISNNRAGGNAPNKEESPGKPGFLFPS
jgi:hypothetical protein